MRTNHHVRENRESVKVFRRRQFRGFDGGSVRIKDAKTLSVVNSKHSPLQKRESTGASFLYYSFSRHASKLKIAYHSINLVKNLKYRTRVINKQRAKVWGMCDTRNSCYLANGIPENYSV